jgi:probable HAF family extracellular repeat protein
MKLWLIGCIALVGANSYAVQYEIIDLGDLPTGTSSGAWGINAFGNVTGTANINGDWTNRGFIWQNGVMKDIGDLGGTVSDARSINDMGQVVGWSYAGYGTHAFVYENGKIQDLGTLGGDLSEAYGINNYGQVVGRSTLISNNNRATLWTSGQVFDLGTLGGSVSAAWGINDLGQIVGNAYLANDISSHAFLHDGVSGMVDLGTLGGSFSIANSINNIGQIVGYSDLDSTGHRRAFIYENGIMSTLGTIGANDSYAQDINNMGTAVGYIGDGQGYSAAIVWQDGQPNLIDNLIAPGSGNWRLMNATSINDSGWIVGWGYKDGITGSYGHAYMARPLGAPNPPSVPGPVAGIPMALGLGINWLRRRKA